MLSDKNEYIYGVTAHITGWKSYKERDQNQSFQSYKARYFKGFPSYLKNHKNIDILHCFFNI